MQTTDMTLSDQLISMGKDEQMFEKALDWVSRHGYDQVRANIEGYPAPTSFTRQSDEDTMIPDITATNNRRKSYFEIAVKSNQTRRLVSKWTLISNVAEAQGGKFILFAPHGHKAYTTRLVERHGINARVIAL